MAVRGLRGATTTSKDDPGCILEATQELLLALLKANPSLETQDIASAIFTSSPDLHSVYPARAARQIGWTEVPLLCMQEIYVPEGLKRCIRILIHWNTDCPQSSVKHVYLHEAIKLRPDLQHEN